MSYGCTEETTVYLGHDNAVEVIPYSDIVESINYDMTSVTQVDVSADLTTSTVSDDDITADSTDSPVVVWWAQVGDEWRIYIKAGMFVGIVAGTYKLRIIIIEPANPNGVVIADDLEVIIADQP